MPKNRVRLVTVLLGLFILFAVNSVIYRNEAVLKSENSFFLALTPLDPRDPLRGDYMSLRYEIDDVMFEAYRHIQGGSIKDESIKDASIKIITIRLDEDNVASFVDFGVAQAEDLRQLKVRIRGNRPVILPNRFYFQEGLQDRYQAARYAYFKMSDDGHYLLADLADESRVLLSQ